MTKRNGSETTKSKKTDKISRGCLPFQEEAEYSFSGFIPTNKHTNKAGMEPQDARVGGSVAVREGASAPATPSQHDTMFGAKDAAAVVERMRIRSGHRAHGLDTYIYIYLHTNFWGT